MSNYIFNGRKVMEDINDISTSNDTPKNNIDTKNQNIGIRLTQSK